MAPNFQITYYRYEDGIHLKLYGDLRFHDSVWLASIQKTQRLLQGIFQLRQ